MGLNIFFNEIPFSHHTFRTPRIFSDKLQFYCISNVIINQPVLVVSDEA